MSSRPFPHSIFIPNAFGPFGFFSSQSAQQMTSPIIVLKFNIRVITPLPKIFYGFTSVWRSKPCIDA